MLYILIIVGSILNRARGSKLFGCTESTAVARWVFAASMGIIAALMIPAPQVGFAVFLWVMLSMYFWSMFGWREYCSAAVGNEIARSRLWGLGQLSMRHSAGVHCLVGLCWLSGHWTPLIMAPAAFGLPYYLLGYVTAPNKAWAGAEYVIGAAWVLLYSMVLNGV